MWWPTCNVRIEQIGTPHVCNSSSQEDGQKHHELEASLDYIVRAYLKEKERGEGEREEKSKKRSRRRKGTERRRPANEPRKEAQSNPKLCDQVRSHCLLSLFVVLVVVFKDMVSAGHRGRGVVRCPPMDWPFKVKWNVHSQGL